MKNSLVFDNKKSKEYFLNKISFEICPKGLQEKIKKEIEHINIIDIRDYDDYINGHIPYAIHVPVNEIEKHLNMFEKNKINIIYSYNIYSMSSDKIALILAQQGFPVIVLMGGFAGWEHSGFDIVKTSSEDYSN